MSTLDVTSATDLVGGPACKRRGREHRTCHRLESWEALSVVDVRPEAGGDRTAAISWPRCRISIERDGGTRARGQDRSPMLEPILGLASLLEAGIRARSASARPDDPRRPARLPGDCPCPRSSLVRTAGTSTRTGRTCWPPASGSTDLAMTRCGRGTTSTRSSVTTRGRSSRAGWRSRPGPRRRSAFGSG